MTLHHQWITNTIWKKFSQLPCPWGHFLAKFCLISSFSPPRSQNLLDFVNDMAVKYSLYPESPEFYFAVTDYKLVVLYKQKNRTFCCVRYNRNFATTGFVICGVYCISLHIAWDRWHWNISHEIQMNWRKMFCQQ